jgi:hypothetical protein
MRCKHCAVTIKRCGADWFHAGPSYGSFPCRDPESNGTLLTFAEPVSPTPAPVTGRVSAPVGALARGTVAPPAINYELRTAG